MSRTQVPDDFGSVFVTAGVEDGKTIVTNGENVTSGLFIEGKHPGKSMKRMGKGAGDYVQVTTYRYVGPGGEFNVHKEKKEGFCSSCMVLACLFLFLAAAIGALLWYHWPTEGKEWLHEAKTAFLDRPQEHAMGNASIESIPLRGAGKPMNGVEVRLRMVRVDYAKIAASAVLHADVNNAIREAVTYFVGHGASVRRVFVSDLSEEGEVVTDIVPPCGTQEMFSTQKRLKPLVDTLLSNLRMIGVQESPDQPIEIRILYLDTFAASCDSDVDAEATLEKRMPEGGTGLRRPHQGTEPEQPAAPVSTAAPTTAAPSTAAPTTAAPPTAAASTAAASTASASTAAPFTAAPSTAVPSTVAPKPQPTNPPTAKVEEPLRDASGNCKFLTFSGADGASAQEVNGDFRLQATADLDGPPLYRKVGDDNVWLAFMMGRWYVTDTARKDANSGGGWLYSEESTARPIEVSGWEEWSGTKWEPKLELAVQCGHEVAGTIAQ